LAFFMVVDGRYLIFCRINSTARCQEWQRAAMFRGGGQFNGFTVGADD